MIVSEPRWCRSKDLKVGGQAGRYPEDRELVWMLEEQQSEVAGDQWARGMELHMRHRGET